MIAFAACNAPIAAPLLPTEPEPRQLLEAVRRHDDTAITALLADDVTAFGSDGGTNGPASVSQLLSGVTLAPDAGVEAHHGVARVTQADGTLLFVHTNGAGRIAEVVQFAADRHATPGAEVTDYQQAWNVDAATRGPLLQRGWAPDGTYLDPTANGTGRDGLSVVIDAFRARVPGVRLDAHDDALSVPGWVTFSWSAVAGASTIDGFDVARLDAAGQVSLIAGFFSKR